MLMDAATTGDQFGVSFNFNYILLQIRENGEDYAEARIKLTPKDVDELIEGLQHFKDKVVEWQSAVGVKKDEESEQDYNLRIYETLKNNKYFTKNNGMGDLESPHAI